MIKSLTVSADSDAEISGFSEWIKERMKRSQNRNKNVPDADMRIRCYGDLSTPATTPFIMTENITTAIKYIKKGTLMDR